LIKKILFENNSSIDYSIIIDIAIIIIDYKYFVMPKSIKNDEGEYVYAPKFEIQIISPSLKYSKLEST
jgi:hypothetical protein